MFAHATIIIINELQIDGGALNSDADIQFVYQLSVSSFALSRSTVWLEQTLRFDRFPVVGVIIVVAIPLPVSFAFRIHCLANDAKVMCVRVCVNFHTLCVPVHHVHAISANNNTFLLVLLELN